MAFVDFYGEGETLGTGSDEAKPRKTPKNLNMAVTAQLINIVGALTAWKTIVLIITT